MPKQISDVERKRIIQMAAYGTSLTTISSRLQINKNIIKEVIGNSKYRNEYEIYGKVTFK